MRRRLSWWAAIAAVCVAGTGGQALAQGAPDVDAEVGPEEPDPHGFGAMREEHLDDERAHSHFRVGTTLYREGRFLEAAREFDQAFELSGRASLRFNAYLAYRDAGDLENAARSLREYVTLSPDAPDNDVLVRRARAMEAALAEREAAAEAQARERAALEAERQRLEAERQALEAQAGEPPPEPQRRRIAPWIVGGVGAGLLLNAAVNGIIAGVRVRDLEAACPGNVCPSSFDLEGARTEARTSAIVADVSLFTGLGALTAGVLMLVIGGDGEPDEAPPVTASCGPTGCGVELQVRFR